MKHGVLRHDSWALGDPILLATHNIFSKNGITCKREAIFRWQQLKRLSFQIPFQLFQAYQKIYQKLATSIQCCSDLKRPQHARNCFPTAVATKIRKANSKSHPCFVPFCPLRLSPYPKSQKNIKNSKAVLKSNIACCAKPMHMLCGYLKDREVLSF